MGPKRRRLLMGASIAAVLGLAVAAGWSSGFPQTIAASNTAQFSGLARNRIAGLAPAAIAMAPDASRILKCEGPFARNSSHAKLVQTFGQQNVREGSIYLGEGENSPGSIIYPNDPQIKIEITWKDTAKLEKISWLYIHR